LYPGSWLFANVYHTPSSTWIPLLLFVVFETVILMQVMLAESLKRKYHVEFLKFVLAKVTLIIGLKEL
jgi:hypothetical protein